MSKDKLLNVLSVVLIILAVLFFAVCFIFLYDKYTQVTAHGQVENENLLLNPSFEDLDPGSDHPTHWTNGHSKHTSWLVVPDGNNYGYVLSSDDHPMYQDITYTVDSTYVLRFWSGKHNNNQSTVTLSYLDKEGNVLDSETHVITHIVDTDKQLQGAYELTLAPNNTAQLVRVEVSASNGWGKVDNMMLWSVTPNASQSSDEPKKLFLPNIQK